MDGVAPFPTRDLSRAFLKANLERSWVGERTRAEVEGATSSGELLHQPDGTLVWRHRGRVLGSPTDDLDLCRSVRESHHNSAYVLFGLGLGHTARALRALTDAPILIYEPDPGLARHALELGPSDLGDLPLVCTLTDLTQLWPTFGGNRDHVTLISTPGYAGLYQREDRELRETIAELIQRRTVNDATHRVRSREWISDVLENLELLERSPFFLGLAEKYQGVPAFIVGAGPSLGKNIEHLAGAAKKGIVFAVNSSALALARHGIIPQVVACMESIDLSHLLAQVPYLNEVVRAFSMTAHPRNLRSGTGPLLPVYEGLPQFAPLCGLGKAPGLAVCGSVSTLAFTLAQRLGCSPIVLVGQDLAYTGGQTYAAGTPYEGSRVRLAADGETLEHDRSATLQSTNGKLIQRERMSPVPAWGGRGTVHSTLGFSAIRSWLALAADVLAHDRPDQRLINATEGGAHVPGFEELPLQVVLAPLADRNITPQSLFEAAVAAKPPLERGELVQWLHQQLDGARAARHAARRLRRWAKVAERALQSDDPRSITRAFAKLEAAEGVVRRAVQASPFVDGYAWTAVDDAMRGTHAGHANAVQSAGSAIAAETQLGTAIETCTRELERQLELVLQRFGASAP